MQQILPCKPAPAHGPLPSPPLPPGPLLCRFNETPVLPFNAFGTMALARSEFETNDASSQFFFLLKVRAPLEPGAAAAAWVTPALLGQHPRSCIG